MMKNEYKMTKALMMSWAKEYHLQGVANIVLFVLWCIVGLSGLAMIVLLSLSGGKWIDWYLAILFLVLSIYKLLFSRFVVWSNRYKLLSRTYGVPEWTRTTEFADEEIILCDHTSIMRYPYKSIKRIIERGNAVTILLHNNLALRIYKDAFTDGSWEACRDKIESMMK